MGLTAPCAGVTLISNGPALAAIATLLKHASCIRNAAIDHVLSSSLATLASAHNFLEALLKNRETVVRFLHEHARGTYRAYF